MKYAIVFLLCYFLGNINVAFIAGKIFSKSDIRDEGSGNAGSANALRTYGAKVGLTVLVLDVLKGVVAMLIGRWVTDGAVLGECAAVLGVIVGHIWPVMLRFKGGKGIATIAGTYLMISPPAMLISLGVALLTMVVSKMVSLGSVLGVVSLMVCTFIFTGAGPVAYVTVLVGLIAIFAHRENIKRIISKEESKLQFKK